jgi:hypothetical protein
MFVENRVTQGLPRSFNKSYFDLIDEFMHIKLCFNPQYSHYSMNLKDDIYCGQLYLRESSPHDYLDINEEQIIEDAPKRNASPLAPFDPIPHCVNIFQEGDN